MHVSKHTIVYVTSSEFKMEENRAFMEVAILSDGARVKDEFEFDFRNVSVRESLEVDLSVMVNEEVKRAYSIIRVPCIVEHAGIVFADYADESYPGGLTKPMWDTLGERFLEETRSAGRRAIARAVVSYCNGRKISTFVGETEGKLADRPRGLRQFYWDTIFIPDLCKTSPAFDLTYAEIADHPDLGLQFKMEGLSQSARAMLMFLEKVRCKDPTSLWR